MRSLPIVELSSVRATQSRLTPWIHAARLTLVVLLLVGLNRWAKSHAVRTGESAPLVIDRKVVESFLPAAESIQPLEVDASVVRVLGASDEKLGLVTQTSPHADTIVGYAGPSNVLVVMDEQWIVTAIHLIRCPDTIEHLRKVQSSRAFWNQFVGWKWGETAAVRVDGVSGATLTSLAIAESVAWRMAAANPAGPPPIRRSLRFSSDLDLDLLQRWYPEAAQVRDAASDAASASGRPTVAGFESVILDAQGNPLGIVIRTGPLSDSVIGYQGPSEVILRLDENALVSDLMLGESFDNQPYVNYVKQEASFWRKFKGRSLESLAGLDLDQEQIDGVSGATMTSIAVTETIRDAAAALLEDRQQRELAKSDESRVGVAETRRRLRWNWSLTELITVALAVSAVLWSRSHLRGRRVPRLIWQSTSLVLLGLVCGNLLSVALLGGWTRGGVPWRLAPGLTALVIVAVLGTAVSKGNVYCDHLCPHGILQQWIRPRRGRRIWPLLQRGLWISAWVVIGITVIGIVRPLAINLAWLEPFDAYVVRVGVSFSLVLWGTSLVLARLKPMAYCRLACPTGKLLDYLRRDASRHRISMLDIGVLLAAPVVWLV